MYVYPSPLSFKKAFIMLVPRNGTAVSSTGGTESLLLQGHCWVAVGGCSSRFGWKQGGLEDALPYT